MHDPRSFVQFTLFGFVLDPSGSLQALKVMLSLTHSEAQLLATLALHKVNVSLIFKAFSFLLVNKNCEKND